MTLRFHPDVQRELRDLAAWHEEQWAEAARSLDIALAIVAARADGGGSHAEQLRNWLEQARSHLRLDNA